MKKALVAYFSASSETARLARTLADVTGGGYDGGRIVLIVLIALSFTVCRPLRPRTAA